MLKSILMILLILLLFNGCTPKIEYVYIKPDKYEFAIPSEIKPVTVKLKDGNAIIPKDTYIKYITLLRNKIKNLTSQIEDYNKVEK